MTVAAVLAGCTVSAAGQAAPAPGDAPNTSTATTTSSDEPDSDELPTDGAPKVDDPLDTTKFQEDPCLSLTSEQSEGIFGFSATGEPYRGELGKACKWQNEETSSRADVRFLDEYPRGLSAQYAAENDGKWAYFESLVVEGYPAVTRSLVDGRDDGTCTVVVGASDEISFEVPLQLSTEKIGKKDPCEVAADIAGEAVKTMQAG